MLLEIGGCSARRHEGLHRQEAHPWRARWAAQSCRGPRHAAECPPHAPAGRQEGTKEVPGLEGGKRARDRPMLSGTRIVWRAGSYVSSPKSGLQRGSDEQ